MRRQGIASSLWPTRRCIWTDHAVTIAGTVSYRVTAIVAAAGGTFAVDPDGISDWTETRR
jgi:hypothetical protein